MTGDDPPLVLIVEDEPDVAETYQLWLESDYRVRTAEDGTEGLEKLESDVDVVLLDRRMPGLNGDDVLDRISERGLDCRVAMVTAVEPDFDILEMGFDAYLSKPVASDQLGETVETLLDRSAYDGLLQEYYALVEKQATLETSKTRTQLASSEEYDRLQSRVDSLRAELSETLDGVDSDEDFVATIRGFDA
jgi:two-component system response regulator AdeR